VTTDWRTVASDQSLDGVILAVPPTLHPQMASVAIDAGIPLLLEKPLALSYAAGKALAEAARARRVLLMVDHTHLHSAAYAGLRELGATFGPLLRTRSAGGGWGPVRHDASVLWDWGPHDVSMCLDCFRERPHHVSARRTGEHILPDGRGEALEVTLHFSRGRVSDIALSNIQRQKQRVFEATFEQGTLIYDDRATDKLLMRRPLSGSRQVIPVAGGTPLSNLLKEFCRAIKAPSRSHPSLAMGLAVAEVLERCQTDLDRAPALPLSAVSNLSGIPNGSSAD
jgi:predicted dehydrogenase